MSTTFRRCDPPDPLLTELAARCESSDDLAEYGLWQAVPGGMYIALDQAGRPIGMCAVHFPRGADAWLHFMRIDPTCQDRGAGTAFSAFVTAEAFRLGAAAVRLCTHWKNVRVHRIIGEKLGYRAAARLWRLRDGAAQVILDSLPGARPGDVRGPADRELPALEAFIRRSGFWQRSGGLVTWHEAFHAMVAFEAQDLADAHTRGELLAIGPEESPLALALLHRRQEEGRPFVALANLWSDDWDATASLIAYAAREAVTSSARLDVVCAAGPAGRLDPWREALPEGSHRRADWVVYEQRKA